MPLDFIYNLFINLFIVLCQKKKTKCLENNLEKRNHGTVIHPLDLLEINGFFSLGKFDSLLR